MTVKELVLDHLDYTFAKEAWQPSLAMAVEGLNARQAAWKPAPDRHSIWQAVRHVILWKQGMVDAWTGKVPDLQDLERRDWAEVTGDDAAWHADVQALHAVSTHLRNLVQASDDQKLASRIPTYAGVRDQVAAARLVRMATHDIYHAGQIRYIRALQGA